MSGVTGALYSAVSGLQAQATNLATISDNIANANTVGYKKSAAQFSTLVTIAASQNSYTPGGVMPNPRMQINQQGTLQSSTSATDIAVTGRGFFATTSAISPSGTPSLGSNLKYTRAGSFQVDKAGYLTNTVGQYLLGVPAVNGTVPSASLAANQLQAISVGSITGSAKATSSISIGANLAATANSAVRIAATNTPVLVGANSAHASSAVTAVNIGATRGAVGGAAATGMIIHAGTTATFTKDIANMQFVPADSGFVTSVSVFDSLGVNHNLNLAFQKKSPNVWNVYVTGMTLANRSDPNSGAALDSVSGTTRNSFSVPAEVGTLQFTPRGSLSGFTAANGNINAPFSAVLDAAGSTGALPFAPILDFGQKSMGNSQTGTNLGVTQMSDKSAVSFINQDGIKYGYRSGVSIGADGLVQELFDNGQKLTVGKVPLVTFPNPDQLQASTGNLFDETQSSGSATANYSQVGGAGKIVSNSLESSTVDLSTEFSQLIVTQNSYAANTKVITSANNFFNNLLSVVQ